MGCPCTKNAGAKAFVYVAPDGTKTERRTEIEANAAQIRAARAAGVEQPSTYGEVIPVTA